MNRNNEYNELLHQLENTPLKLDFTLERARARKTACDKRRCIKKAIFVPLGTIAAVFVIFAALVNFSAPFADACSKIPVLSKLAEAVYFSPSLSTAVENDYMQEIGLERTKNDVTARIEYVIVDQKQLNIFYSLSSDKYSDMEVRKIDTNLNEGYFIQSSHTPQIEDGSLRNIVIEFDNDYAMPDSLDLTIKVYDTKDTYESNMVEGGSDTIGEYEFADPVYITEFDFMLEFDPSFTATGEVYEVGNSFEIDGQTITLETAEVYPTHTRLTFSADDNNTAWLTWLDFYIENDNGKRFDGISDGTTALGQAGTPMLSTYMIESLYFYDCKHLTLCITGAKWLEKGKERMHVNLTENTAENLPEGVALEYVEEYTNGWHLFFSMPKETLNCDCIGWDSYDADGKYHLLGEQSRFDGGIYYERDGRTIGSENQCLETITIYKDEYPYDEVWISNMFTYRSELDSTLSVKIK